ncbi:glucosamine-6-phosphate deaminase [Alkalihalobacillus sp. CinArs1]|uniref:glucosamine-6-phosphate deaminase n=1 Tax=Alkalihalobacillus sp. CinArs1 TaxID=2995314 RepID=UPI0022DD9DC3|nr:glucosamine-6-phosphate deaminase [Alkalihalobacillus sp. CinArs1]
MKFIMAKNKDEANERAGELVIDRLRKKKDLVLGLPTGNTPVGIYLELVKDYKQNGTTYHNCTTINIDEYIGLNRRHPNSYHAYMHDHLFDHIDIQEENTYIPDGTVVDVQRECERYDKVIKQKGPLDLLILGIGHNGHIGFNEPGTSFDSTTHLVELTEETKKINAKHFSSFDEVPRAAITMGLQTMMESREILLVISGEGKADAYRKFLETEKMEDFPASVLKGHPNLTVIVDEKMIRYGNVVSKI